MSIHIAAKGLRRSSPWAQNFGEGEQMGANSGYGISILGCMVPTTCGAGSGKDQGSEGERTGSEWSECISILGFRVPTTCGGKKFGDHLQCMSVPTTWN